MKYLTLIVLFLVFTLGFSNHEIDAKLAEGAGNLGTPIPFASGNSHGGKIVVGIPIYKSDNLNVGISYGKQGSWNNMKNTFGVGGSFKF